MIEIGLLAFMISGAFLGFVYLDLIYQIIGTVVVLKILFRQESRPAGSRNRNSEVIDRCSPTASRSGISPSTCGLVKRGLTVRSSRSVNLGNRFERLSIILAVILCVPASLLAQKRAWTTELIDSAGSESSLAVDADGNLHVSYYYPVEGSSSTVFVQPKVRVGLLWDWIRALASFPHELR